MIVGGKMQIENILPLKPMQTSMMYQYFTNVESKLNSEILVYKIHGCPNVEQLGEACTLSTIHNAIKSVFVWKKTDFPLQIILSAKPLALKVVNTDTVEKLIDEIWDLSLDITKNPYQIYYLKNPDSQYFVIRTHHILLDGWSQAIWLRDVILLYDKIKRAESLCIHRRDYADYVKDFWLQASKNKNYWINHLDGFKGVSKTKNRSNKQRVKLYRSAVLNNRIYLTQNQRKMTFSQCFYAIWVIYLIMANQTNDVAFNIVASGRGIGRDYELDLVGMLINTVPARFKVDLSWTVEQYLAFIKCSVLEILIHQEVNTIDLLETMNNNGLINIETCLDIQNYPISSIENITAADFSLSLTEHKFCSNAPFILAVRTDQSTMEVELEFCYDSGLYNNDAICKIIDLIEKIARWLSDGQKKNIKKIMECGIYDKQL